MSGSLTLRTVSRADLRNGGHFSGRYRDFLLNHPLAGPDEEPLQIVAMVGDQQVGKITRIPGRLVIDGEHQTMGWGAGLYVDPEYRSTGAGALLLLRFQSLEPLAAVVGVSHAARPLYAKLGWSTLPMQRYVLLRRSRSVLEKLLHPHMAMVAKPFVDSALWCYGQVIKVILKLRGQGYHTKQVDALPPDLERHFHNTQKPVVCFRSTGWVNHTLAAFPHSEEDRQELRLVLDRSGQVVGYFAVTIRLHESASATGFRNLRLGSVKDWMSFDAERIDDASIVLLAVGSLLDQKIDAIEVCAPDSAVGSKLRQLGVVRRGELLMIYKASSSNPLANPSYADSTKWWFRPGDGDNFFF